MDANMKRIFTNREFANNMSNYKFQTKHKLQTNTVKYLSPSLLLTETMRLLC